MITDKNQIIQIALDGPSGAGKSTVARMLADRLGIDYIDTGAMYRAVGYKLLKEGLATEPDIDENRLRSLLDETEIDFAAGEIYLDGAALGDQIRTGEIAQIASRCSALPAVREKLVSLQREMGKRKSIIMDGRDIGTNVFPDAPLKFYLTASAEERARRRCAELVQKGENVTFSQVLTDIQARDQSDSTRKLNPLVKAEDAIEIDSTDLDLEGVLTRILQYIDGRKDEKQD